MKRKTNVLTKAGVLLVAVVMLFSALPAMAAEDGVDSITQQVFSTPRAVNYPPGSIIGAYDLEMGEGSFATGAFVDAWIGYGDMESDNGLGLTAGGTITMIIELTSVELAGFYGDAVTDLQFDAGSDLYGTALATPFDIWIETALPVNDQDIYTGGVTIEHSGVTNPAFVQQAVTLGTAWDIPASGSVFVGINYHHPAGEYPCGFDTDSNPQPNRAGILAYQADPAPGYLFMNDIGYPSAWCILVGVGPGGVTPGEDCIEDACDFAIWGFSPEFNAMSNYDDVLETYYWNSLPKTLTFSIANRGTIGISEVKILVDIYEKICGPTSEIFCDPKYDIQLFEVCPPYPYEFEGWMIYDDLDGDSWVLQGGPDNRWLTNNQAWRATAGEDRSFGDDADVYLGKNDNPAATGLTDDLITPGFDIAGAACAEFSFSHWAEGEYTTDDDGYIIPVDYGTIAYSLDGGVTWTNLSFADFLAYDTFDEWVDVTLKFINTCIDEDDEDYMHPYATVCEDCAPEEGDVLIEECFPDDAELMVKFMWHKDPCLQFEGWYIDNVCVYRTEDYHLELVYQGHIIMELDPCEGTVEWIDIDFPIDWDPKPDTWYELWAHGQVFSPIGCEIDLLNNWFKTQFKIIDIHDMACIGMELLNPEDGTGSPGDSVQVNVTVKNLGTFTESNVPVDLFVGDMVLDEIVNTDFETDPSGLFTAYYFIGGSGDVPFRWTAGDGSIDNIYTNDPAQARSKKPGFESLICAEEGTMPYLAEDTACYLEIPGVIDLDRNDNGVQDYGDPVGGTFNFYAKWSMECEEDTYYGGYYPGTLGSYAALGVSFPEGPAAGWVLFVDFGIGSDTTDYYENDWQYVEFDLFDIVNDATAYWEANYGWVYEDIPAFNIGWVVFADGIGIDFLPGEPDGGTGNPLNPVPWSGLMLDRVQMRIIEVDDGTLEKVASTTTGSLAPGAEETVQLTWSDAELCHHALVADVNADDDINPNNDKCFTTVRILDQEECFPGGSADLTTGSPCLWHVCTNRENGDDFFAWTGIVEEHWAHYVNNMDDAMVSPTVNVSGFTDEGVAVNFTHYYELASGDFGEVIAICGGEEITLMTVAGSSNGGFEYATAFIPEEDLTDFFKLKFRFVSDDEGVSEGWFIDDIYIVDVIDDGVSASLATPCIHGWIDIGTVPYSDLNQGYWCYDEMECIDDSYVLSSIQVTGIAATPSNPGSYEVRIGDTDTETGSIASYDVGSPGTMVFIQNLWGSYPQYDMVFDGLNIPVDPSNNYLCVAEYSTALLWGWMPSYGDDSYAYTINYGARAYDLAMYIEPGAAYDLTFGDVIEGALTWLDQPVEDFERGVLDPWICDPGIGGNYWKGSIDPDTLPNADDGWDYDECEPCVNGWYVIEGYPATGTAINNAQWFELDLTDEQLIYAKFEFYMDYDLDQETIYVEFSPDWEPGTDMNDATWTAYFIHTPGDNYGDNTGGWVHIDDLVGDDRFVLEEYLGSMVYVRFRLTTPGNGAGVGAGWAIDGLSLVVKRLEGPVFQDTEAPVTSIFFDGDTGMVTLVAVDYPLNKGLGVKATYYTLDGVQSTYTGPFNIGEGEHTVQYWSEDNAIPPNVEAKKSATYIVDTTEPTVEIKEPTPGIYFLGNKLLNFGSKAICIGKVPILAEADDGTGSGIARVLFDVNGDTGYDASAPYEYTFRGMNFGSLTIKATAVDNKGLLSAPDEIEVTCFSLGLL
jgi:hypothetical protein